MQTNFLTDASARNRFLSVDIGARLQYLLVAALPLGMLLLGGYYLGFARVQSALSLNATAQRRLAASETLLAQTRASWSDLRASIREATRLRMIRLSGTQAAERLARVGNDLPNSAWLTSFTDGDAGFEVRGGSTRVGTIATVFETVAPVAPSRLTVSVARPRDGDDLDFDLRPARRQ
jgi:hypothetical protein